MKRVAAWDIAGSGETLVFGAGEVEYITASGTRLWTPSVRYFLEYIHGLRLHNNVLLNAQV